MATLVFTNAQVLVNAVDLSDHVDQATVTYQATMLDNTVMGNTTKSNIAGLFQWDITVDFLQDFAASKVDATLFPLVGAAAFAIEVRPVNAARSATNPGYNGNCVLSSYPPMTGKVGDLLKTSVKFMSAGTLSRSTV